MCVRKLPSPCIFFFFFFCKNGKISTEKASLTISISKLSDIDLMNFRCNFRNIAFCHLEAFIFAKSKYYQLATLDLILNWNSLKETNISSNKSCYFHKPCACIHTIFCYKVVFCKSHQPTLFFFSLLESFMITFSGVNNGK